MISIIVFNGVWSAVTEGLKKKLENSNFSEKEGSTAKRINAKAKEIKGFLTKLKNEFEELYDVSRFLAS